MQKIQCKRPRLRSEAQRIRSGRHPRELFAFKRAEKQKCLKLLADKTRRRARRSAERSLTPESHLDEKVRSAETIERE